MHGRRQAAGPFGRVVFFYTLEARDVVIVGGGDVVARGTCHCLPYNEAQAKKDQVAFYERVAVKRKEIWKAGISRKK